MDTPLTGHWLLINDEQLKPGDVFLIGDKAWWVHQQEEDYLLLGPAVDVTRFESPHREFLPSQPTRAYRSGQSAVWVIRP